MTFRDPTKPMWVQALKMLEQADRLQRHFFQLGKIRTSRPMWEPPIDIFETEESILILVALPGVEPDDVDVIINGKSLHIISERTMPASSAMVIRRLEIPYGRFERRITLPNENLILTENILENGCLRLVLSKFDNR